MKLLIAIPALNEEQSIRSIIERSLDAREHITAHSPVTGVEITVVSDGSTDRTVERALEYKGQVKVIVFPENRGYGAAIMEAWRQSSADLLSFLDADGTCEPRFFADLCRTLETEQADVVLGCRMNPRSQMPRIRRLGNAVFALLLASLSNKRVKDTASGMRVVRRSALQHLYPLPTRLHFTPAMSARAVLSDSTRIAEIDMPYAEREGRSKLSVVKDGIRFLNVILGTALLYRPGRILTPISFLLAAGAALLMLGPLLHYWRHRAVEEWMIYRFLVSSLVFQVGLLLWGASGLASRIVSVAIEREIHDARSVLFNWIRTPIFWPVLAALCSIGGVLIWPSAVQLLATGHTDVHWSRFVVSMTLFGFAATVSTVKIVDRLLNLVQERVRYLAGTGAR